MPTIPSLTRLTAALLSTACLVACGPPAEEDRAKSGPIEGPFVVSNFFTPSGLMGDGAVPGRLTVDVNKNCKKPRPPGAQGDCYRFFYKPADIKWAGAFWVSPSNNWGTVPGRNLVGPVDLGIPNPDVPGSPNLRGYNYVRFYLAMEPLPVENNVVFWAGRLDGRKATPPQPHYDKGCSVFPAMPPAVPAPVVTCTDTGTSPPSPYAFAPGEQGAVATAEWQQFKIDLSRWSVEQVIGAFGYATNDNSNPGLPQVIYFDDIVWE
jgi:hypothetical protein